MYTLGKLVVRATRDQSTAETVGRFLPKKQCEEGELLESGDLSGTDDGTSGRRHT